MTTDQLTDLDELLVTATRCVEMQHTGAAMSALAKARRLLGELFGKSEELATPEPIDRTLPPGFEVVCWQRLFYVCQPITGMHYCKVWSRTRGVWETGSYTLRQLIVAPGAAYEYAEDAYADKARWLKAAGVEVKK